MPNIITLSHKHKIMTSLYIVRTFLSMSFCPILFCPYTTLSMSFCPYTILSVYHFVQYHFVRYHFLLYRTLICAPNPSGGSRILCLGGLTGRGFLSRGRAKKGLSAEGAKLRLPKARSPTRLWSLGECRKLPSGVWDGAQETDAILKKIGK